jgi:hypothetical protein
MLFRSAFRTFCLACLALWCWGGPVQPLAWAQRPDDGALKKLYDAQKDRAAKDRLFRGEGVDEKNDQGFLDRVARYHVMRVVVVERTPHPKEMYKVVEEFRSLIKSAVGDNWKNKDKEIQENHDKFLSLFGRELVKSFQKVLALPVEDFNPKEYESMLVHTSLMLEPLGQVGQPEVATFLAGLVKDPKIPARAKEPPKESKNADMRINSVKDVIRLYAFKGLRECFMARPPEVFSFTQDPEREAIVDRLQPIVDFLAGPPTLAATASEDEVAAFRYIRREAVRALAETRLHSVPFLDGKTLKAPVAHALARVLAGDKAGMAPPPRLSERLEAAIGLCQMKGEVEANRTAVIKLQPDLVVGLVGKTVVELAQAYQQDYPNIDLKTGKLPRQAWKAYADRMGYALKDLQATLPAKADVARKNAAALEKAATPLLKLMRNHKGLSDLQELQDALRNMPRPEAEVYVGASGHQIELGAWPPVEG